MYKPSIHKIHKEHDIFGKEISVVLIHQYNTTVREWKFHGYRCKYCDVSLKGVKSVMKHPSICKTINTTKKQKEKEVPIQVITQNGKRMYRYGDTGKLYPNRADAEKQAAAIIASGYKEKKEADKK
jgi:hypothetical protein